MKINLISESKASSSDTCDVLIFNSTFILCYLNDLSVCRIDSCLGAGPFRIFFLFEKVPI